MMQTADGQPENIQEIFERYHAGWEARNPEQIASMHSADTLFWVHDGTPAIKGRDALTQHCTAMFARMDFRLERQRLYFGPAHWVFDWLMVAAPSGGQGSVAEVRIEMLDLVTIDAHGLVTRKDVYFNGAQAALLLADQATAREGN